MKNADTFLWRYNARSGFWDLQRGCHQETAMQWFAVFSKDDPQGVYAISKVRPKGKPKVIEERKANPVPPSSNAESMAQRMTDFYTSSVGKKIDTNKEFSLLSDWQEAIARELKTEKAGWYRKRLLAMRDECKTYLNLWGKRKNNPVPPSSQAGKRARASAKNTKEKAASDLYRRFTGNKPWPKARRVTEENRDTFLQVGTVDGVLYTTNRDGKVEQYIHHFRPKSRPSLLVSHDGKVARTRGGKFTFTERGFVDEDADGNPVE